MPDQRANQGRWCFKDPRPLAQQFGRVVSGLTGAVRAVALDGMDLSSRPSSPQWWCRSCRVRPRPLPASPILHPTLLQAENTPMLATVPPSVAASAEIFAITSVFGGYCGAAGAEGGGQPQPRSPLTRPCARVRHLSTDTSPTAHASKVPVETCRGGRKWESGGSLVGGFEQHCHPLINDC